jgi:uncharacterized protein YciI
MANFIVLLEDDPQRGAEIRREHMPAHLAFLDRNAHAIRTAGPLSDGDGQPAGGLWLVEAGDLAEVEALTREDPFWAAGLRSSVRVLAWRQVFRDGKRL